MLSLTLVTTDVVSHAVTVFTRLRTTGTAFIFLMSTFTGFSTVMAFRSFAVGYFHTSTTAVIIIRTRRTSLRRRKCRRGILGAKCREAGINSHD